ncbi:MAG: alpha/beta fold hydrolase [Terriglobia bacterium]
MKSLRIAFVTLLSSTLAAASLGAQVKRPVQPEDLVDIRGVDDIRVSPDGRAVAFVVTELADPKKKEKPETPRNTNIWMVPADGSRPARPFVASPKNDSKPRWSPDGRYLAFLSNRGEPIGEEKESKNQIYLIRVDGGEAEQLTRAKGGVEDLEWSRDGQMIAYTVRDAWSDRDEKRRKEGQDQTHVDHDYKFARLWVMNLSERKPQLVTKQDLDINGIAWSPDGDEMALLASATPRADDRYWHKKLIVVRRQTGEIVSTLSEHAGDEVKWSPDGATLAFEEFTPVLITSWLAVAPAAGGTTRYLLKDYPGTVRRYEWEPDSKHLVAEVNERTRDKFVRIDVAADAATDMGVETALPDPNFSLSADGHTIAYEVQAPDRPSEVWALRIGETPKRLTDLQPQAALWELGAVKEINWKNKKDGQTLYGVLVTPPDYQEGRPYPTVVEVHGGPEWAWWSGWLGSWHEWAQLLASHGYVVFLPNPRGSTGQGWKFAEANRDDWGGGDFQDIMDGVDYLVEQKIADPNRLGIGGWSYGGFMTSWAVTQTRRFKAAVVGAGVTNLFSFAGTTDITPSFLSNYFINIPFFRRPAYEGHSAMTYLKRCRTPSLVLHGEADERVPVTQGWEFYNGLKMLRVPTEMVVYPREHHGFKERAHQIDLLTRVLAWYDKYLKI